MTKKLLRGNILGLIGNTPMARLNNLAVGSAELWVKLEFLNPSGSIKDRIALAMVEEAESKGKLGPGGVIVEATAGNTGISLAMVAAAKGYRAILVMPENTSVEHRRRLLRFGAEVVLSPALDGMAGATALAEKLAHSNPNYFLVRQFENPANPEIHRRTTAREILRAIGNRIDAFVAGIGTGGTITGVGEVLKQEMPKVRIIGVEPAASPLLSQGLSGPHGIPGIGANFVPPLLKREVIDEIIAVPDAVAHETASRLAREEGIWAGISGGANVWASLKVARALGPGNVVVTILPDGGERYWEQAFSGEVSTEATPSTRGV